MALPRLKAICPPAALLSFSAMSSLLVYGRLKHKQPSVTPVAG
ncbi:MFS transporter [Salmonella enterica subsp. enterica serovar Senftenberg]|nr:MFS transporter [Salmonella enterica subsp. enterica serovar Senftenberg]